jgi:hypothetical protein
MRIIRNVFPTSSSPGFSDLPPGYLTGLSSTPRQSGLNRPLPPVAEAMFDYSRVMAEEELYWINGYIQKLEVENG